MPIPAIATSTPSPTNRSSTLPLPSDAFSPEPAPARASALPSRFPGPKSGPDEAAPSPLELDHTLATTARPEPPQESRTIEVEPLSPATAPPPAAPLSLALPHWLANAPAPPAATLRLASPAPAALPAAPAAHPLRLAPPAAPDLLSPSPWPTLALPLPAPWRSFFQQAAAALPLPRWLAEAADSPLWQRLAAQRQRHQEAEHLARQRLNQAVFRTLLGDPAPPRQP